MRYMGGEERSKEVIASANTLENRIQSWTQASAFAAENMGLLKRYRAPITVVEFESIKLSRCVMTIF